MGIILGLVFIVALFIATTYAMDAREKEMSWACEEDEVLAGVGDFDGKGWDSYECVPADDLR